MLGEINEIDVMYFNYILGRIEKKDEEENWLPELKSYAEELAKRLKNSTDQHYFSSMKQ